MLIEEVQFQRERENIINALTRGELVVLPTETVYGLAANALDETAVESIFSAKGRPTYNPIIVHVYDKAAAQNVARWNETAELLADAFWPGPLTIVLPKQEAVPQIVTAGGPTVAVRSPAHPKFRSVLKSGLALAAPSANISNGLSPTRVAHLTPEISEAATYIVDGGTCEVGLESTVVAAKSNEIEILRPGMLTAGLIESKVGIKTRYREQETEQLASPGLLKKHYSPRKPLVIGLEFAQDDDYVIAFSEQPRRPGIKIPDSADAFAREIFNALWEADQSDSKRIVVERPPETEAWRAVNDRLSRASS